MENNQKVGLSNTELVLSIGGIIVLILLIALPPIFRIVFEEETYSSNHDNGNTVIEEKPVTNEQTIDDSSYTKITCMKQTTNSEYVNNTTIILAHENGLLKVLTEDNINTYLLNTKESEGLYTNEKLACNNLPNSFKQIDGFNYSCNVTDDSVHITKKYNLNSFKPTSANNHEGVSISINSPFIINQNTTDIVTSLTSEGYTCE